MKVAFASSNGAMIDQHFATSDTFYVWEIGPQDARFLETVAPSASGVEDADERITSRADALRGCTIVCSMQIGGPASAKLVACRIHPMKTKTEVCIKEVVAKLQEVIRQTLPPWIRKIVSTAPMADEM